MNTTAIDKERRRFLTAATTVVGGVGALFAAFPFVEAWSPSAKAEAAGAPVEVDISELKPGDQMTVAWRSKPVWVVHRTQKALESLTEVTPKLRDPYSNESEQPPYAKNAYRSLKPQYLVVEGICTHLGCSPKYRPYPGTVGPDWKGGFFCPCHGSLFDFAGRVFQGVPAPTNLVVPPYRFLTDSQILIGRDPGKQNG